MEYIKQEIEADLHNIAQAEDMGEDDIQVQRYIKKTKDRVYVLVCKLGREATTGYVRTNKKAFELGQEWLNEQGVEL